jgi:peptidoglycan hydrolase-like protein with peptidoglycan-binding domain
LEKTTPKWKYDSEITFSAPKRNVDTIFLHCSASDVKSHDDIAVIKRWHTVDNKWSHVGYHFFINKNGDIQEGCSLEKTPIAQKGHNTGSIAICLHGLKKSKFTEKQLESVKKLCKSILGEYTKKIRIRGHCEVSSKSCPVFEYKSALGLDSDGYIKPESKDSKKPTKTPLTKGSTRETGSSANTTSKKLAAIRLFSKGTQVQALQQLLTRFGYTCLNDGQFGKNTEQKVREFQKRNKLQPDGIVGVNTVNALFSSEKILLKRGNRGADVSVLQLLLAMFGRLLIHDGILGSGTETALKTQQRLLRTKVDGVFGSDTRKKMLKKTLG